MDVEQLFKQFKHLTYVKNGRTKEATDCWGFVTLVYKDFYGISLPTFSPGDVRTYTEQLRGFQGSLKLLPANAPEIGCFVGQFRNGLLYHVGLYLGNSRIIHLCHSGLATVTLKHFKQTSQKVEYYAYSPD